MALTGQLSDMSLAELIEFFCNQRKTGRLKIDYPRGHSVFFIREGELVDARVGALSGVEAVYFSLTLPNAAFDFSPDVHSQQRTINERWTQVVLEGLRRLDEGQSPTEADAFGGWSPTEADLVTMFDQVENLDAKAQSKNGDGKKKKADEAIKNADGDDDGSSDAPFSMMVESASASGGGRKKWMIAGVAASVVLACAVAAIPLMSRSSKPEAASVPAPVAQPAQPAPEASAATDANASTEAAPDEAANAEAADAARRDALERERKERERKRKAEEAANKEDAALAADAQAKPTPAATGPKSVRVTVTYDEAGRVTQASVAGATPGAEAYGSTAVRIARGRRFPAGKAGSTVVTIPVN